VPSGWSPWADRGVHLGARLQQHVDDPARGRVLDARGRVQLTGESTACAARFEALQAEHPDPAEHAVVLLHGLFRSRGAMAPLARALAADGMSAHALHYPSTRRPIDGHADQVEAVLDRIRGPTRVSLVGHSLGGLVALRVLARAGAAWRERLTPHRAVTIASPHHGAELAGRLSHLPGFVALAGPALPELLPGRTRDRPHVPVATIAGARGRRRGLNPLLAGDDDLTVRVEEALLEDADDQLVVRAVHTFISMDRQVIDAVRRYLVVGRLAPDQLR